MASTLLNTIDLQSIPKQADFVYDPNRYLCYSGGYRSGKTFAMLVKFLLLMEIPNNRGFIGRLDGKDLRLTTMRDFFRLLPTSWIKHKNDQLGYIELKNGSEIIYSDMKDLVGKAGGGFGVIALDQGEELDENIWAFLKGRLSLPMPRQYMLMTCNPEGHNWIWRMFKNPSTKFSDHKLYEGTPYDNPFLPKDYIPSLLNSGMPDYWIKRFVYGEWDAFSEQIYPSFDTSIHVIDPFPIPTEWLIYESLDHGLTSPTSCHQYAIDFKGNVFAITEHYEANKAVSFHAQSIKGKRIRDIATSYSDPTMFNKNQSDGKRRYAISDVYADNGIFLVPYNNDWKLGYDKVLEYLNVRMDRIHPIKGRPGSPSFFVFRNCTKMIEEFINYKWKKIRGKIEQLSEEPTDANDHAMDESRGFLASRPSLPKVKVLRNGPLDENESSNDPYAWMMR